VTGLVRPLGIELFDRVAEAEARGELAKRSVLFGNNVALRTFLRRHGGLVIPLLGFSSQ